ncbi:hypothetical protein SAMN04488090_1834 [Siphonobacter aquaeclarae]|uniref:Uncharacterized protein n=1 Tax=Siphonobacter aquaeclarae TaxID=563176 RepID=A0A1G9N1Z3_9BACT|nr:hypothetical protein SAMN04488090_1834 [Siphonobacter aquaeclarae]
MVFKVEGGGFNRVFCTLVGFKLTKLTSDWVSVCIFVPDQSFQTAVQRPAQGSCQHRRFP